MNALPSIAAALLRTGARLVSRGGGQALLILTYHRVLAAPDPLLPDQPDAREFAAHLDLLGSVFNVLPLTEAFDRMRSRSLPPRAVSITFDDGYANNLEVAGPLLRARGMAASLFIAPGFLDGGRMFNDTVIESIRRAPAIFDANDIGLGVLRLDSDVARRDSLPRILQQLKYRSVEERRRTAEWLLERTSGDLPRDLMLTAAQVRQLAQFGIEVGAHTVNHPILARVDEAEARREILESRAALRDLTGDAVSAFAYPNGRPGRDYSASHVQMVREAGYSYAVSTAWGRADASCDPWQLPRIAPWDRNASTFALRMLRACLQRGERVRPEMEAAAA